MKKAKAAINECPRCDRGLVAGSRGTLVCSSCGKSYIVKGRSTLVEVTGGSDLQVLSMAR